jgi:uncharacterized protein
VTATPPDPTTPRLTAAAFTRAGETASLRIAVCRDCAARWFPPLGTCARCAGTDLAEEASGDTGEVYASTVVRIGPPGFTAPYVLSYVDIDGVRLLAHTVADDAPAPGTPVRLAAGPIGERDGAAVWSYRVHPVAGDAAGAR